MKKVAIIGANSYIARNVIYKLKSADCEIVLYDYAESQMDGEDNYTSINILSKESIRDIDFACDIIFMFVGKTGSMNGFDDYKSYIDVNEIALLNSVC